MKPGSSIKGAISLITGRRDTWLSMVPISIPKHMMASSIPQYLQYQLHISGSKLTSWLFSSLPYLKLPPTQELSSMTQPPAHSQNAATSALGPLSCPHSLSSSLALPQPRSSVVMSSLLLFPSALDSPRCLSLSHVYKTSPLTIP